MNLPPKDPLRATRYAAFFVKPTASVPGHEDDEDEDELVLDEEDHQNDDT